MLPGKPHFILWKSRCPWIFVFQEQNCLSLVHSCSSLVPVWRWYQILQLQVLMINDHSELADSWPPTNHQLTDFELAGLKFEQRATPRYQFKTSRNRHAAVLIVNSKFYHTELQFTNINYTCAFPTNDYCTVVSAALPCCSFCGEASAAYRRIGRLEETWPIF